MYLEFAGLPGSGKSTLSSALKEHLITLPCKALSRKEAIILCIRRRNDGFIKNMIKRFPHRIWWPLMSTQFATPEFITLSSRHLEFVAFLSKLLSESNLSKTLVYSIWETIIKSFIEVQLISQHTHAPELVIMDEAFSQRCFTLFGYMENSISDELILSYAKLAPIISQHVLWIDTDPHNCIERLKLRYQNQISPYDLNSAELLSNFKAGNNILKRLYQALKDQGKYVHHIDGNEDKNISISNICETATMIIS